MKTKFDNLIKTREQKIGLAQDTQRLGIFLYRADCQRRYLKLRLKSFRKTNNDIVRTTSLIYKLF